MSDTLQLLTTSRMRAFKLCRRLHWYRYELGLTPIVDSLALRFGTAVHHAIEIGEAYGIDAAIDSVNDADASAWADAYTPATIRAIVRAYFRVYESCPLISEVVAAEKSFHVDLINPETGAPSRTFQLAGKIDAIVTLTDGRLAIRETKTTAEQPDETYWRRLLMDPQISLYYLACRELGYDVQTIVYDVVRKPCMRPARATPIEARKYTKAGTLYANQRDTDETPEEWEGRLLSDILERPDFYLCRREIPRLDADIDALRWELWDIAKDMRTAQLTGRHYRNAGKWSCDNCAYFNLCSGLQVWDAESGIAPEGFQILSNPNPELEEITHDGSTNGETAAAAIGS